MISVFCCVRFSARLLIELSSALQTSNTPPTRTMNTQKENPTDAAEEYTGTSVPLPTLLRWDAKGLQDELRRAVDKARSLCWQASGIETILNQAPEINELQEIFDKVQHLLAELDRLEATAPALM